MKRIDYRIHDNVNDLNIKLNQLYSLLQINYTNLVNDLVYRKINNDNVNLKDYIPGIYNELEDILIDSVKDVTESNNLKDTTINRFKVEFRQMNEIYRDISLLAATLNWYPNQEPVDIFVNNNI